ncbi:type II toxin-antitoxin system VapC family toxin [Aliirhizobium terrae]|uniref:type II toxin-antitoxin system VapC family toxin n=1 Tax=Terrirhizobium terrae TaxID=2926709 RepID=UPI00336A12CE
MSENQLFFSAASIWELTIKYASGRSDYTFPPAILREALIGNGFQELPITSEHGLTVGLLPPLHKDPFDRILIAQAMSEGMLLITSDETIAQYDGPIRLVR